MVGFDPDSKRILTKYEHTIAGATSGFITRLLCQPLDVIKIRFQLQIEPIKRGYPGSKYQSLGHGLYSIIKEEGILALWKGHVPAQGLSILYGAVQFSSFEYYTKKVYDTMPGKLHTEWRPLVHFACGALAGSTATLIGHPLDTLRTRLVAQGEPKIYHSIHQAVFAIARKEGIRGFYKGLFPTLLQITPYAGAQFGFYRLFQELWIFSTKHITPDINWLQSVLCGAAAGTCAKAAVYPFDLFKKRLQIQGFEEARKPFGAVRQYQGLINCIYLIWKEESFLGFYKGFLPSLLKASATTACHFVFYDQMCKILAQKHH